MNRRHYLQSLSALFATTLLGSCAQGGEAPQAKGEQPEQPQNASGKTQALSLRLPDDSHSFLLVSDLGRNGYYKQKPIAELMGNLASKVDIECVVAAGDTHHFNGIASIDDPLWMTNYELIYSHPELMINWFPVCGNHEYRGNTQAVIDYSKVSRRWMMPSRYYYKVVSSKGTTVRVVFVDTTPLIQRYRNNPEVYPDARMQNMEAQLQWLDATLRDAKEDWVIVVGHHPIYAQTEKNTVEQEDLRRCLLPVLQRYHNVSIYACGHIHDFQHIKMQGDDIDYVVNSAGALARDVKPIDGTVFCSEKTGFSVIAADKKQLSLYMIDKEGNVLHTVSKNKQ